MVRIIAIEGTKTGTFETSFNPEGPNYFFLS